MYVSPSGAYFSSFLDKVQSRSFKDIEVLYLGIICYRKIRADSDFLVWNVYNLGTLVYERIIMNIKLEIWDRKLNIGLHKWGGSEVS